jgi:hypothetical protein
VSAFHRFDGRKKKFTIPSEIPPTLISESAFSFDLISPTQLSIPDTRLTVNYFHVTSSGFFVFDGRSVSVSIFDKFVNY